MPCLVLSNVHICYDEGWQSDIFLNDTVMSHRPSNNHTMSDRWGGGDAAAGSGGGWGGGVCSTEVTSCRENVSVTVR